MTGDVDTSKSTLGYLITFGGGVVSSQSRLQKYVALSFIKYELIATVEATKALLWMNRFLGELALHKRVMCFIATFKALFILDEILYFMIDLNILM